MKTTLEMAREAGADTLMYWDIEKLKRFEALVRADERAASVQEPVARQYQGRDGVWNDFISEKHYKDTLADGSWPIRNLYTDPPAPTPVPLTDELEALFTNIDHAISSGAWNVQKGSQTWEVIEEAKAAHGITEKGD